MPPTVVVLHSEHSRDKDLLDRLHKQLQGLRGVTIASEPLPGSDTVASLRAALGGAVRVIVALSPDFPKSAADESLRGPGIDPRDGRFIPLLLRPFAWQDDPRLCGLEARPRSGQALSLLSEAAQDQAFCDLVAELRAALPETSAAPLGGPLWVTLTRAATGVVVGYRGASGPLGEATAAPPPARELSGDELFHLLFPHRATTDAILRGLDPTLAAPSPRRFALPLRIVTSDPTLVGQPYQRTAFMGQPLRADGWTFALAAAGRQDRALALEPPPRTLCLGQGSGREDLFELFTRHRAEDLLEDAPLSDPAAVEQKLRRGPQLVVALSGTAAEIDARLQPHPPPVCLLCLGDGRAAVPGDGPRAASLPATEGEALLRLAARIPLLLWPRPGAAPGQAERLARRFLDRFLSGGADPLTLLHDEWPERQDPLVVFASYDEARVPRAAVPVRAVAGPRSLDRDEARAVASRHVSELRRRDDRRVEALIAYGSAGNLVEHFAAQATDTVRDKERVPLHHERFAILSRAAGPLTQAALAHDLRVLGGADSRTPLWDVLRGLLPARRPGQVLWLDFGVFGAGHQATLKKKELAAWAAFGSQLAEEAPPDLRAVLYLGLVVSETSLNDTGQTLEAVAVDPDFSARFRCSVLHPLGRVTLRHLWEYTRDPDRSRCGPARAHEAAKLVYQASHNGVYEEAVRLLDEGERSGYAALLRRLRGDAPHKDDDDRPIGE